MEALKELLTKYGYTVNIFNTKEDAAKFLDKAIDNTSVGMGGSKTIEELNLYELLSKHNEVYWHQVAKDSNESLELRYKEANTKVYLSSVNAISKTGELVNIDGVGNRLASTLFGHEKVYFIIGKNKIEDDLDKAIYRARNIAAPKNAMRLNTKTPCAINGDKCYDCKSQQRICHGLLVLYRAPSYSCTNIILINENLGF